MTKKPVSNAPPPFEPVRGLSLPRSQSNGAQVHQVHKPDWTMWSGDQRVEIEQAVALTMDIDPTPLLRVQDFITPDALPKTRRKEFSKRQDALQMLFSGKSRIKLSEAMAHMIQKKWSGLPPELVAMAVLPPDTTPKDAKAYAESAPTTSAELAPTAKPEPFCVVDRPAAGKRWTPEELEKLRNCRTARGTKAAADHFGISTARVRELLPGRTPTAAANSVFNHRLK